MKKKTTQPEVKYTRGPSMKGARVIKDFLPPPGSFKFREPEQDWTISIGQTAAKLLAKQAGRVKKSPAEFATAILHSYAETLR